MPPAMYVEKAYDEIDGDQELLLRVLEYFLEESQMEAAAVQNAVARMGR